MLEVLATSTVRFMSGSPEWGSFELGELHEHVGHLVAALAAADVDDDLGVGPLGELVLGDGLARAERPGDAGDAALGEGEERVDDALPVTSGSSTDELALVRPGHADRPPLHHDQVDVSPSSVFDVADGLVDRVAAALDRR